MEYKYDFVRTKTFFQRSIYSVQLILSKLSARFSAVLSRDYVKTIIVLLIIVFLSYMFAKRIALEHLRTVVIFSIFLLLAAASINLKSGITAIIIYLPFMAFIRRYIYVYSRYVKIDPILIISDVITIWIFGYLVLFRGKEIYRLFRENKIVRFVTILLFVFILQMFNPRQGNILVGFGGAKFYIIPLMWFYFGLFLDRRFMEKTLVVIVLIGVVTALYGLKQTYFGFTPFEKYWINFGGYAALHLLRIIRSFSTFASAGEYAHYLTISGMICFAFFLKKSQKIAFLVALTIILIALFISAVRSAIFMFIISSVILIGLLVKDKKKGVLLSLLLLVLLIIFISKVGFTPQVNEYNPLSVTSYHTLKGVINPMGESSFRTRLWDWFVNFPRLFIKNPFGYGLGISTLAAWKFGSHLMATESLFLDIMLSNGIIGTIVFIILLFYIFRSSFTLTKEKKTVLGILAIIVPLSYFLIGSSSEYSIFPIVWLLWGVIARGNTL